MYPSPQTPMKILKEAPDGAATIQLEEMESIIVFMEDGGHEAFISIDPNQEEEEARESALEATIALIALTDPYVRAIIEAKISNA